jgi:chromosome partitioning protein
VQRLDRARKATHFMPVIAVINRKGGSGKSTLATHLAAYCATTGKRVMLGDVDRQQSTQTWLKLRGARNLPDSGSIQGWAIDPKNVLRVPGGVTHVVLDTPGGMRGFELARIVMNADAILMPVCNSVFDRESAAECYAELRTLPRVANGRCKIAAIGMRLDARTKANEVLGAWAKTLDLPFIGVLRETQAYVRLIENGLTLFDVPATQVRADMAQWRPILEWLDPVLNPQPAAAKAPKPEQPAPPVEAVEPPPARPMGVTRPVLASAPQGPRPPAPPHPARPRPIVTRAEPARPALGTRLGQLLDTLPIPRFLQRNP